MSIRTAILAYLMGFAVFMVVCIWTFQTELVPILNIDPIASLCLITVVILALGLVLGLVVSRRVTRPIIRLSNQARELALGDTGTVFEEQSYREVAVLADGLNLARQQLDAADELRREMAATLSHDLRTPLTMIMGYAEAMRDLPGENTAENIEVILEETRRLARLVEEVMEQSKRETPLGELRLERYDYGAAIRRGVERYGAFTADQGYVIEYRGPKRVMVRADRLKVSRVVYNLLNNAAEHGGEGGPVTVTVEQQGDRVVTRVSDRGRGIPPEEQQRIWSMYYSYSETEGRAHVGLGLAIVRRIMDLHGMSCGVESRAGQGSTFWFTLPLA